MKVQNKFKTSPEKESYEDARNAFFTTLIVLTVTFLISLLSKELALGFLLVYLVFTTSLIRWSQQSNK